MSTNELSASLQETLTQYEAVEWIRGYFGTGWIVTADLIVQKIPRSRTIAEIKACAGKECIFSGYGDSSLEPRSATIWWKAATDIVREASASAGCCVSLKPGD